MYVCELTKRKYRGKKLKEIRGPDDVAAFVGPKLRKEQREHFLVLLLGDRVRKLVGTDGLNRRLSPSQEDELCLRPRSRKPLGARCRSLLAGDFSPTILLRQAYGGQVANTRLP